MLRNSLLTVLSAPLRSVTGVAVASLVAVATFAVSGWSYAVPGDSVRIAEGSKVWVEGGSTVRSWKCEAVAVNGKLTLNPGAAYSTLAELRRVIGGVQVRMAVDSMACGNDTMDKHMKTALKAKEAPAVTFLASDYDLTAENDSSATLTMRGTLSIAGTEKPAVVLGKVTRNADGSLTVTGEHKFAMTQFGVKPPSLMLGTMKVKDDVTVGFEMILR
jgi:hypothetical protein